jgi:hypothetical protein
LSAVSAAGRCRRCGTLETALSFEDAIRAAIDLGGDTDTVAVVTGGLAGAYYGWRQYPPTGPSRSTLPSRASTDGCCTWKICSTLHTVSEKGCDETGPAAHINGELLV